jgi:hypothetical protein
MKNCLIKGLSISIDNIGGSITSSNTILQTYLPVLRLSSLSIAALLPIFSYIEGVDLAGDEAKVAVEVQLGSVHGAINDQQIEWIFKLLEKVQRNGTKNYTNSNSSTTVELGEEDDLAEAAAAQIEEDNHPNEEESSLEDELEEQGQMKALVFFRRIWDAAVDEASYIRNLELSEGLEKERKGGGAKTIAVINDLQNQQQPTQEDLHRLPPTQAELTLTLHTLRLQVGIANTSNTTSSTNISYTNASFNETTVAPPLPPLMRRTTATVIAPSVIPLLEIEIGLTRVCTASMNTTMLDAEVQVQNISIRHNSSASSGEAIVHILSSLKHNDGIGSGNGATKSTSPVGIVAEEEAVWDEILGIHPCEVPLRSAGRLRSPENALEFQKIILDNTLVEYNNGGGGGGSDVINDKSTCSIHMGQVWIAIDPLLRQHVELFMARLASMSPSPATIEAQNGYQRKEGKEEVIASFDKTSAWSSISGWDIEIDALQVALRCLMKNNNNNISVTIDGTTATETTTSAALLLQATEAISYHTRDTANAFRPQGFQCPLIFSVVHGWWQVMSERSGQHTAAVPGAVMLSKAFTLNGSLGQDHSIQGPFFSISPLVLDGSGEEIAAALNCILAAVAGGTEPRDPLPLLSGWAGRAQLSLKQGLRLNKDLKSSNSSSGGGVLNEEKAWKVFASSLALVLTSSTSPAGGGGDGVAGASVTTEEEVCALLDLTTLRCNASPGVEISMDLVCLGVEMHSQAQEEEKTPPPLAVLTNFKMRSEESVQECRFGSLNLLSEPSTTRAAMALAAVFKNRDNTAATTAPTAPATSAVVSQVPPPAEENKFSSKYGFDMVTFTLLPPQVDLQTPITTAPVLGVTGWLSYFSLELGPQSRQLSLNCVELSQCRLTDANSELIKLPLGKVLRQAKIVKVVN